jgi:putative ABC transport system permease protein
MHVIWHKIWNDIWKNKSRTAQVVVIIAMGAFAIGMIITTSEVIRMRLAEVWQAATPAMINLVADPPLDDEQLTALKSIKGVTDVEGYLSTNIEWRLSPDQPWSPASLIARADYKDQTYAKLTLLDGQWPSRKRVAVEKGSDSAFNLHQGQPVTFQRPRIHGAGGWRDF